MTIKWFEIINETKFCVEKNIVVVGGITLKCKIAGTSVLCQIEPQALWRKCQNIWPDRAKMFLFIGFSE